MKVLLAAVNAKYIHTSLSVRSLYHYAAAPDTAFCEFTINERSADVLSKIYCGHYDAVLFSCYIWNIDFILEIAENLKKISPRTLIILGGPEVSFDSVYYMEKYTYIDGIIRGEGEETFKEFIKNGLDIDGVTLRKNGRVTANRDREPISDISTIPFPYTDADLEENKNKLIYYESSRGCPFKCSYCLSSVSHGLRTRDTELVKKELMTFISHKVRIVKFVDRTFNADRKRTVELLRFLTDNAAQTEFHFEIEADLINGEIISELKRAPSGLFRLEIGIQSTNPDTVCAVDRNADLQKIADTVCRIKAECKAHVHLDLIAGLPYEDINSFKKSFNDVFALKADVMQLGFLKLLRGTKIRNEENKYGYEYMSRPPYEILKNDFLSYDDILLLKGIEDVFERYWNSGVFRRGIEHLLKKYPSPFDFFKSLWEFFKNCGYADVGVSRLSLYGILCEFEGGYDEPFRDLLKLDYFENNKGATTPKWSLIPYDKSLLKTRFDILSEDFIREYLPEYCGVPPKEAVKSLHFERFLYIGDERCDSIVIFDNKHGHIIRVCDNADAPRRTERIEANRPL